MEPANLHRLGGKPRYCLVCGTPSVAFFMAIDGRRYWRCVDCCATFLEPGQRPSRRKEYAHYCEHRNDPADPGYRRFLSKLADPLMQRLSPGAHGLDYGCGPGPALARMLQVSGYQTDLYDVYFFPDPAPLDRMYDFITCTETVEHFYRPAEEFARLDRMLRPGGWLAVMTCFQTDDERFASWHYRREPTHVVFYREFTLRRIARQFGWRCEVPVKDVALMRKPPISDKRE